MASAKKEMKMTQEERQEKFGGGKEELKSQVSNRLRVAKPEKKEAVYTADEFCRCAQALFHARPECVRAALREKNMTQCSRSEAEKIVRAFIKKEVK